MLQCVTLDFNLTAGSPDSRHIAWPFKGDWQIEEVYYAPSTTLAANATDYVTITVSTADGAAGSFTSIGSISNASVAMTIGTSREVTVSGAGLTISQGSQIKMQNTEAGSPGNTDGCLTVLARKVP